MPDLATVPNESGQGRRRSGNHWHMPPAIERARASREPEKPPAPTMKPAPVIAQAAATPSIALPGRVLAVFADYNGLHVAVRDRVDAMELTRSEVGERAGLPDRYVEKVLGPSQIRKFGNVSLGPTLGAIGCYLVLIEDPVATAKILARAKKRQRS